MTARPKSLATQLRALGACGNARAWANPYATLQEAWDACERADWMLWLLVKIHGYRGAVVHATVDCAETALPLYEKRHPGDSRVRECLAVARRWADGKATLEELREARRNADAVADYAAYAADYAAYAADYAAYAADYAADDAAAATAADAAAYAAAYAEAEAEAWLKARIAALARMAEIIRQRIPDPEVLS